ncbi:RluA family pseudouridine synthase [Serpentinicella alkaliphila]|uniref:Pseudouridine synthase n=1 Tax=Serpentinicella alkaliphila TaxID=1734049 RepID=A0A4R2TM46_9FIRM|nr:ribosomal large subunit pseudouridine synthase D [Serpentinicella alkaliphila]
MENQYFYVSDDEDEVRLDVYLAEQYEEFSRSYIQKLITGKHVKVNNTFEKNKYLIKAGDSIEVILPEPQTLDVKPQNIPLDIVYEDQDIIIINKPQGMVVHPGAGNYTDTLVNALLYHCDGQLSSINGVIRPGIVHRIDKDTSGLLMVAKNNVAHQSLAEQLKEHSITRKYHAICTGIIKENRVTINAPIGRHPVDRLKMTVIQSGRNAVTYVNALQRFKDYTYIEAQLETGRTHQIRVHLSYIKHPLLGDEVYGKRSSKFNLKGQVLHAKTLGFIHPRTNEYMEFNSDLPDYFKKLLEIMSKNVV